jgi:hypothetical protein
MNLDVQGSGFWVQGSGFRVLGSGFRVLGSRFKVLGSKVWGFAFGFDPTRRVQRRRWQKSGQSNRKRNSEKANSEYRILLRRTVSKE